MLIAETTIAGASVVERASEPYSAYRVYQRHDSGLVRIHILARADDYCSK